MKDIHVQGGVEGKTGGGERIGEGKAGQTLSVLEHRASVVVIPVATALSLSLFLDRLVQPISLLELHKKNTRGGQSELWLISDLGEFCGRYNGIAFTQTLPCFCLVVVGA